MRPACITRATIVPASAGAGAAADSSTPAPTGRRSRPPRSGRASPRSRFRPAWTDVWICPSPNGHLQATGRDARGRKQYRYHPRWREVRDEAEVRAPDRLRRGASAHPPPRQPRHRPPIAREAPGGRDGRAPAGRDEHPGRKRRVRARERLVRADDHAQAPRRRLRLADRVPVPGQGREGERRRLSDPRVARVLRRCEDLPGQHLFQYLADDGEAVDIDSDDVNDYLREATGEDFTAKDFRTWSGTVLAAWALEDLGAAGTPTRAKRQVVRAVESVAKELGNTPAVCRSCYVHPGVIEAHLEGNLARGSAGRPTATCTGHARPDQRRSSRARPPAAAARRREPPATPAAAHENVLIRFAFDAHGYLPGSSSHPPGRKHGAEDTR